MSAQQIHIYIITYTHSFSQSKHEALVLFQYTVDKSYTITLHPELTMVIL